VNRDTEYAERFKKMSDDELVAAFNREVGNPGWTSSRASYLAELRREFTAREYNYSAIGDEASLSFKSRIRLNGKMLEIVDRV
jgi:hypothetical protein